MKTGQAITVVLILLLLGALLQFSYDSRRDYFGERDVFVSLPSSRALAVLSFGYRDVVADLLFIWAIQFYSNYNYSNRFDYIESIFNLITDLKPGFRAAYYIGSIIMALEGKRFRMAIRLLDKGARNMPDEWVFDYEAAYYAQRFLADYPTAKRFYERAAKNPRAPDHVRRGVAHMAYMSDNLEEAYRLWSDIYRNSTSKLEQDAAVNHLYQIKYELDRARLEEALKRYRKRYGRYPIALGELKRVDLIDEVPRDFFGESYHYDAEKGTISASRIFRWKKYS